MTISDEAFSALTAKLPHCSAGQLLQLKGRVALLLQHTAPDKLEQSNKSENNHFFYDQMCAAYSEFSGHTMSPWPVFLSSKESIAFNKNVPDITKALDAGAPGLTKLQRGGYYKKAVLAQAEYMRSINVPVSPLTLLRNLHLLLPAFDKAYPGYREAGLVGVLLESK